MPTYTYVCQKCAHTFDVFHAMSAKPRVKCEACGSLRCTRQIGIGSGIIFKGSGFYETDYKSKKGAPPAAAKKADGEKKSGDSAGSNGKTETKPKSKDEKATKAASSS